MTKIDVQRKNKVVDVFIDYTKGSKFQCVQCEELCGVHGSEVRRTRHLDLFEYQCSLNIRMPRIKCKSDGVMTIRSTKLFRAGSHYTFLFENRVMRLCKEMNGSGKFYGECLNTIQIKE